MTDNWKHLETFGNAPEGNTKTSGRIVPSRYWCFTLFYNDVETLETLETCLAKLGKYYFGEEVCPTTGKQHLQGFVQFETKCRPSEKVKIKEIHWEKTKGSAEQNIAYCGKDGKIHTNMKFPRPIKDPLEGKLPYPWQQKILDRIKVEPDSDRHIYWYWESDGNVGKTALTKHICMHNNAIMLGGKASDIKFGFGEQIKKNGEVDVAIFHLTRSVEEFVSYEAMETLKDGIMFSTKYESGQVIFNPPHVMVFANFPPKLNKMSQDRWIVEDLRPGSAWDSPLGSPSARSSPPGRLVIGDLLGMDELWEGIPEVD